MATLMRAQRAKLRVSSRPAFVTRSLDLGNYFLFRNIQANGVSVFEARGITFLFRRIDILHFHWPDNVLRSVSLPKAAACVVAVAILLLWMRMRRVRIVWTAHNMRSHEQHHPTLENLFWRMWWYAVDGVIFHSDAALTEARERDWPRKGSHAIVIPLSEFTPMYQVSARPIRIGRQRRIGFVGRIRKYKGVKRLITAFSEASLEDFRLLVAGAPESDYIREETLAAASASACIDLLLRFLEERELIDLISQCDLIALPFVSVTNSGSALLALSCGTPVMVPRTAYFEELQREVGAEWVHLFDGDLNGKQLQECVQAIKKGESVRPSRPSFDDKRSLHWAASTTVAFYHKVLSGSSEVLQPPTAELASHLPVNPNACKIE